MSSLTRQKAKDTAQFKQAEMTQTLVHSRPAQRNQRKLNGATIFTIAAALVAAVGILYLLQTNHIANLGYQMSQLQQEQSEQVTHNQQLTAELATYQSIGGIEQMAVRELDMQPATTLEFLTVQSPGETELSIPEAAPPNQRSFAGRLWDRISGTGRASNQESGQ